MRFVYPYFIALACCAAALIGFYFWALLRRAKALERFAQKELMAELLSRVHPRRHLVSAVLLGCGIFLCLVALMRPQWGFRWQEAKRKGIDIMFAVDCSRSMLTGDIKPNRLERAKLAVRDFVSGLNGDRIGLIAFAGSAFMECPLTVDYGGFLLSLENLSTESIPKGGTSLAAAIQEAERGFSAAGGPSRVLILITDGENHVGEPAAAAEEAKKKGVTIYCLGVGSREGELVFVGDEGNKEFLKDGQGNAVKSRLDEALLQQLALAAGGAYIRSSATEFGLERLYADRLSPLEKSETPGRMNKVFEERYQWFLAAGLALILLETAMMRVKWR